MLYQLYNEILSLSFCLSVSQSVRLSGYPTCIDLKLV